MRSARRKSPTTPTTATGFLLAHRSPFGGFCHSGEYLHPYWVDTFRGRVEKSPQSRHILGLSADNGNSMWDNQTPL